ncbi:MAG: hypothetical protein V7L22_21970 [Nostoc sp.]|uniref:hypothetical protein n=1 Tax=Nostoc sp. TaxID=1180 RepID=UPI002FFB4D34
MAILLLREHSPTVQATNAKNAGVVFDYYGHHRAKTGKLYAKAESLSLSRFGALIFLMVQSIGTTGAMRFCQIQ